VRTRRVEGDVRGEHRAHDDRDVEGVVGADISRVDGEAECREQQRFDRLRDPDDNRARIGGFRGPRDDAPRGLGKDCGNIACSALRSNVVRGGLLGIETEHGWIEDRRLIDFLGQ
jgi:hypothetical protein